MEEKKFLYSVRPRKTIKTLEGINAIRTARSLFLNKEEVLECLKHGPVYRRFSNDLNIQITPATVDRYHREDYLTEDEFKKTVADSKGESRGKVEEPKKEVVPTVDTKEAKVEEKAHTEETSTKIEEASEKSSDVIEDAKADANTSVAGDDQVETTKPVESEVDADDHASESEQTTVENDISVSEKPENENDAMSAQVQVDQAADSKPNFQASSLQINTSGNYGKKNKGKNKH